jgi:hypothetical protein
MKIRRFVIGATAAVLITVGGFIPTASASGGSGTEHFLALQTDVNGPQLVFGRGPVHAAGKDVTVNNNRDRFVFPDGVIVVEHHAQSSHQSSDPKNCLFQYRETGVYTLVGGTGAYAHVSGHGTYVVNVITVGCNPNKPPTSFLLTIRAHGPISI